MLKQLKSSEIKHLRDEWLKEQNGECPVLKQKIDPKDATLDHQHKLKHEAPDETGKGCCRGVLHFKSNAWEGKVSNSFKRIGLHKEINLVDGLRNLADYLEDNHLKKEIKYIHPKEKPPALRFTKVSYNQLKKVATSTVPPYKKGIMTVRFRTLFNKYSITPKYYKK